MSLDTAQIITITTSIIGSGVLAALINGMFTLNKDSNALRNANLLDDKKELRNILNNILKELNIVNSISIIDKLYYDTTMDFQSKLELLKIWNYHSIFIVYLDINNKYQLELQTKVSDMIDYYGEELERVHDNRNSKNEAEKSRTFSEKFYIELRQLEKTINLYFAEYYPKASVFNRLSKFMGKYDPLVK